MSMLDILRRSLVLLLAAGGTHCTQPSVSTTGSGGQANLPSGDWLIPRDQVFDGGPGKDGIPAIQNPHFVAASDAAHLAADDLVVGVVVNGEPRAYPHIILDWHEIVNDAAGGEQYSVTYCPLTGSGIVWDRLLSSGSSTFGVSGLLYYSNLIPYDRATNSNWSQMMMTCVQGTLKGTVARTLPVLETSWRTWKELYPNTTVMSLQTGYSRPYGRYPYDTYRTDPFLIFPVPVEDNRLHRKARVFGVIGGNGRTKAYPLHGFAPAIEVRNETVGTTPLVIVGSRDRNFATGFLRTLGDSTELTFTAEAGSTPVVMRDNEGNAWDLFGKAVSGPRAGTQLEPARGFIAYWFAWAAFYPGAEL